MQFFDSRKFVLFFMISEGQFCLMLHLMSEVYESIGRKRAARINKFVAHRYRELTMPRYFLHAKIDFLVFSTNRCLLRNYHLSERLYLK